MRCLVTGGAGFLGSHLCHRLLRDGHDVIALDNLFTGSKRNLNRIFDDSRYSRQFEFIRHDIVNPILLEVDWIFNLACPASPIHYQHNPVKTVKTSVMGTMNMLGVAKRVGARVLQASTSEVYGDPEQHPQTEEYWGNVNPIGPRSCYDEGKRVAETLMMDYHRDNKVDTRIVRIFNTYGPYMAVGDGRVVSNFVVQALKDEPLSIYGDGSQTRCFCYVDDLINGIVKLMEYEGPECHTPFNMGSDHEVSMMQLVKSLEKILHKDLKTRHCPLPENDPVRRRPNCSKALKFLGWQTSYPLEQGLEYTANYFEQRVLV